LGTTKGADDIAVVKMFIKTSNPFALGDRIMKGSSKAPRGQWGKRHNQEEFDNEIWM
jgi:hypothetical protein